ALGPGRRSGALQYRRSWTASPLHGTSQTMREPRSPMIPRSCSRCRHATSACGRNAREPPQHPAPSSRARRRKRRPIQRPARRMTSRTPSVFHPGPVRTAPGRTYPHSFPQPVPARCRDVLPAERPCPAGPVHRRGNTGNTPTSSFRHCPQLFPHLWTHLAVMARQRSERRSADAFTGADRSNKRWKSPPHEAALCGKCRSARRGEENPRLRVVDNRLNT
ncbi:MAG: hypothetical protein H6Q86_5953, partial [candidate division NC10 bacterium]|nr:hypothetical protein [candidate division NC10 bacterium]